MVVVVGRVVVVALSTQVVGWRVIVVVVLMVVAGVTISSFPYACGC